MNGMFKIFSYLFNYIKCLFESWLINFINIDIMKIVVNVYIYIYNINSILILGVIMFWLVYFVF